MIKQQEWADWLHHPVTQAVLDYINGRKDALIEELLNLDVGPMNTEQIGLRYTAYRNALNGIGELLDTDSLKESIVEVSHEN